MMANEVSELSHEKSVEFATAFDLLKLAMHGIDWDYAAAAARKLIEQAARQETLSVFNPGYPLGKNDVLRKQAEALRLLCRSVQLLKECDEMKAGIENNQRALEQVRSQFL